MPRAHASAVINVPPASLWPLVKDFSAHAPWVQGATSIEMIEGGPTSIGSIRRVHFEDGSGLDERLLAADERTWSISYGLLTPHGPLSALEGTMRLLPITSEGRTYMERFVDFQTVHASDVEAFRERATSLLALSLELVAADPRIKEVA